MYGEVIYWYGICLNMFELSFATGRCICGGYRGGGPKQLTDRLLKLIEFASGEVLSLEESPALGSSDDIKL